MCVCVCVCVCARLRANTYQIFLNKNLIFFWIKNTQLLRLQMENYMIKLILLWIIHYQNVSIVYPLLFLNRSNT